MGFLGFFSSWRKKTTLCFYKEFDFNPRKFVAFDTVTDKNAFGIMDYDVLTSPPLRFLQSLFFLTTPSFKVLNLWTERNKRLHGEPHTSAGNLHKITDSGGATWNNMGSSAPNSFWKFFVKHWLFFSMPPCF